MKNLATGATWDQCYDFVNSFAIFGLNMWRFCPNCSQVGMHCRKDDLQFKKIETFLAENNCKKH
jgi:hypothetical protein